MLITRGNEFKDFFEGRNSESSGSYGLFNSSLLCRIPGSDVTAGLGAEIVHCIFPH